MQSTLNRVILGLLIAAVAGGVWFFDFREEAPLPQVVWAVGDIAQCSYTEDEEVAALLAKSTDPILIVGDLAYPEGSPQEFADCFDPAWGPMMDRTYPVPGNHEYLTKDASGYFDYFADRNWDRRKGYYSVNLGDWHVLALNTNCDEGDFCEADSAQVQWMTEDLSANTSKCTLAFMHHPLFDSSKRQGTPGVKPIWDVMDQKNVDLILTGHAHFYERFDPQTPDGSLDSEQGMRQIIVGTGGRPLYPFEATAANSVVRDNETHGALKLTLNADSYAWEFVATDGTVKDSGTGNCH